MVNESIGSGIYEVNGRTIDLSALTNSKLEADRKNMTREDYVRYRADIDFAVCLAVKDGLVNACCDMPNLSESELWEMFYEAESSLYDGHAMILNGESRARDSESFAVGCGYVDDYGQVWLRG